MTLAELVPSPSEPGRRLRGFELWAEEQGRSLYPVQEEALLEVVSGNHVILSTRPWSGKSMVAAGAQSWALANGKRSF